MRWLIPFLLAAAPVAAQDWRADRFHLFYSNDSNAAPRLDRWRTVAASGEWIFDRADSAFGLRLGAEIVAPVFLNGPGPDPDRPFAGIVSLEARDYRTFGSLETTLGLGVSAVGPQTGLADFLASAHSVLNGSPLSAAVISGQVPDARYLEAGAEIAGRLDLGPVHVRPFAAAQSGVETYARAGLDLGWPLPPGRVRVPVTGALLGDAGRDWQFGAGLDVALIGDTGLIPPGAGVTVQETRLRARFSAALPVGDGRATFGLAWLGPEFREQAAGQLIGTVSLSWDF